jgi:hypothetical protein
LVATQIVKACETNDYDQSEAAALVRRIREEAIATGGHARGSDSLREPDVGARKTTTEDMGYAIRDALEGTSIIHIDIIAKDREDPVVETANIDEIELIEISDINNPVFQLASGRRFRVRIFAED